MLHGVDLLGLPVIHLQKWCHLGSGLIGHSQKMTVAASAMAEKKAVGQQS
jgi:hypothetical protein